jgi:hypothetical protein
MKVSALILRKLWARESNPRLSALRQGTRFDPLSRTSAVKAVHQSGIKPLRYLFRLLLRVAPAIDSAGPPGRSTIYRSLWKKIVCTIHFQSRTFLSESFYTA